MKDHVSEPSSGSKRLIPLARWNYYHAWPPIGGLRHLVFHSSENGFDTCLVRVGRRILIDEERFFQWVETQEGVSHE